MKRADDWLASSQTRGEPRTTPVGTFGPGAPDRGEPPTRPLGSMQHVELRSSHVRLKLGTTGEMLTHHEARASPALRLPRDGARQAFMVSESRTPTEILPPTRTPVVRSHPAPRPRPMPRTHRSPIRTSEDKRSTARGWVLPVVLALLSMLAGYVVTALLLDCGVLTLDL